LGNISFYYFNKFSKTSVGSYETSPKYNNDNLRASNAYMVQTGEHPC